MNRYKVIALMVGLTLVAHAISAQCMAKAGGFANVSTSNKDVVVAVKYALKAKADGEVGRKKGKKVASSNVELIKILKAQQQVVAGINYRISISAKVDGKQREAVLVVYKSLSGDLTLRSWGWRGS